MPYFILLVGTCSISSEGGELVGVCIFTHFYMLTLRIILKYIKIQFCYPYKYYLMTEA